MFRFHRGIAALFVPCAIGIVSCAAPSTQRIEVDPEAAAREARIQKEAYVRRQSRDQARVQNLAYPLLTKATSVCGEDLRPYVGMVAANIHQWPKDYHDAAQAAFNLGDPIQVLHVVPEGPAAIAGVKVGDVLLEVAGKTVPTGKKATEKTAQLLTETLVVGQESSLRVRREGQDTNLRMVPIAACNYGVALTGGDEINAYADGTNIYITSGMLRFAESDTEVSTVLSHELAHNAMGHIGKKTTNYLLGSIFDVVAAAYGVNTQGAFGKMGANTFSQDFEAEADYVGLYVMTVAGQDLSEAPGFWRRMGAENPGSITTQYGSTHPGTAERYLALDKTVEEIRAKQAAGEEIRPNLKKDTKSSK